MPDNEFKPVPTEQLLSELETAVVLPGQLQPGIYPIGSRATGGEEFGNQRDHILLTLGNTGTSVQLTAAELAPMGFTVESLMMPKPDAPLLVLTKNRDGIHLGYL